MKGGTRSNRRINSDSVHSLLPNYANSIRTALEKMKPEERLEAYNETIKNPPMNKRDLENIQIYRDIFREEYPDEFAVAYYATPSWRNATEDDFGMSIFDILKRGGKTRRNRRGRGRGRRSLKHKHSKRR
jgi:hypothetical protein